MNQNTLKRKIYKISNKKLQIALRIQMITGMRISEIAELTTSDITVNDKYIKIKCTAKKGSNNRTIYIKNLKDGFIRI